MKDSQVRRHEMFVRSSNFGVSVSASFQPDSLAAELFGVVKMVSEELTNFSATKSTSDRSARQGTNDKGFIREELREDLTAISRTVRAFESDLPGFEDKFRLPRKFNDESLISTALGFVAECAPLVSEFVRHEMRKDFLTELEKKIKLFQKAVIDQEEGIKNRVMASTAIEELVERGMEAVRRLDRIIKNKFDDDPIILAAWERAKHVERPTRPAPDVETLPVA
jgi:hypothetical protein